MRDNGVDREQHDAVLEEEEIDLREYGRVLRRHLWSIIGLGLLAGLLAAVVVFSMEPVYRSTVSLLIEPSSNKTVSIEEVYGISDNKEYYTTQYEILKSRALVGKVIDKLDLANNPEFLPDEDPSFLDRLDWRAWLKDLLPHIPQTGVEALSEDAAGYALQGAFAGRLAVIPVNGSQLVNISFDAHDRKLAARVANTLADTYIEHDMEARLQMTSRASDWLTVRLEDLRGKLRESEQALQSYREQEKLLEAGGVGALTTEQLQDLRQKLVLTEQRRVTAQTALNQVRALKGQSVTRLSAIPAVLQDPVVGSLKAGEADALRKVKALGKRYGPEHPKMIEARADLSEARANVRKRVQNVVDGIEKEYQMAYASESAIRRALASTKDEMQSINRKSYKLEALAREVDSNRQLYELFLNRFKETSETSDLQKVNARIADPAVPAIKPVKPKKGLIMAIATAMGLFFGVLLAFLLEHLDNTIKGASDLEDHLGLTMLGLLPHLKLKKAQTPLDYARTNRKSFFAESIRTVRTSVLLSGLDEPHKVILVTSSVPGEGKSTVAMNLVDSLGEMNKVLLIDADMRRPTVATRWGLGKESLGLSEFVAGVAKLTECVHGTDDGNVFVMPAGMVPPNPLELLSSNRFKEALEALGAKFEHIVIDSAPALAVSDALVLSTRASGVIYVVKADHTPQPVAREGLKRLRQHHAHIIGAVLNEVPKGRKSYYGYSGKYAGYGDGYYGSYGYSKE